MDDNSAADALLSLDFKYLRKPALILGSPEGQSTNCLPLSHSLCKVQMQPSLDSQG